MKKIFYTFMAMTAALSVVGCAKELEESAQTSGNASEEESGYIVLGAYLPDSEDPAGDTKTTISKNEGKSSYSVFWAEGDAISVNGKTSTAINIDRANRKNASFTLPASVKAPYCAVYPAGAYIGGTYTAGTDTLDIKVPSEQKYVKDGIDPNSAIMLAYSKDGKTLGFSHAMAYLKLAVNTDVKSVRINGNNNDAVSGTYKYSVSDKGDVDFMAQMNSLNKATTPNTSIVYSAGDDSFVPAGESMFIAIPAVLYLNGFTLTIVNKDNKYQVVKSNTDTPFEAVGGKVYPTTVTFKENGTYVDGGIYTVEDWNAFINDVNAGGDTWTNSKYNNCEVDGVKGTHLMADIYSATNLPKTNDKLTTDKTIKCEWNGTFYGHNHTITHNGYEQLFTHVGTGGKIQNLTVAGNRKKNGAEDKSMNAWPSVIVLNNAGEINNCESKVKFELSGSSTNAAGICRTNTGTIVNCRNSGSIKITEPTADVNVAGIALASSGTIKNCSNSGEIIIGDKEGLEANGIDRNCIVAGVVQRASGVVEELTNTADITINAKLTAMRTIYLGGVIANTETVDTDPTFIKTSAGVATNVQSCSNTGALKIVKSGAFQMKGGAIGGIAASVNSGTSISDCTFFNNCKNSGNITFYESETYLKKTSTMGAYGVGGVLGRCVALKDDIDATTKEAYGCYYNMGGACWTVIRKDCTNSGTIDVCVANGQPMTNGISGARQTYVGGIAGFVRSGSVRGLNTERFTIKLGSDYGGICAGGILGGTYSAGIMDASVNVRFEASQNAKKIGFVGAVLGWTTSYCTISSSTSSTSSFDFPNNLTSSNFNSGFGGVKSGATINVQKGVKYNGGDVATTNLYGGGIKSVNQ